ncbi:hypothetical protein [Hafnia alvei]|uniref:3-phosphoshikimate 1-carboxyvinyltransferase n=1 Tax=Hafnia alvei TaxID=569 RepID=A0A1C6Z648_HAFAL|nr:hypothetical protein [Hafnia alvei]NLS54105.1 3-phosphoshikimate 1-carboxyvinyltransferase [Hafnia alvei]SCM54670.1 3-phosphoshikimate 1-carboxyvinyltransferase [Hafnia alvei]
MSKVSIDSDSILNGDVFIPSSKPHIQRALLVGLINEFETVINNISWCKETEDLLIALQQFGLNVLYKTHNKIIVKGVRPPFKCSDIILANGSGMLFRITLALSSLSDGDIKIKCNNSLFNRTSLIDIGYLSHLNIDIEKINENIFSISRKKYDFKSPVGTNESTQFLTFLLLISPLTNGQIKFMGGGCRFGYVKITTDIMSLLECKIKIIDDHYHLTPYVMKNIEINIPSDFTSVSYIASSLLSINKKSKIRIKNYFYGGTINEVRMFNIYEMLGLKINVGNNIVEINSNCIRTHELYEVNLCKLPSVASNIISASINSYNKMVFREVSSTNNYKCQRSLVINENIRLMGGGD